MSKATLSTLRTTAGLLVLLLLFLSTVSFAQFTAPPAVIGAHAHNDYEHERPLFEALERGYQEIEVDIFLFSNDLLVAHDPQDLQFERTLRSLYLDPLREHIRQSGGQVYSSETQFGDDTSLWLAVDIKTDGELTYSALHQLLEEYKDILTIFGPGDKVQEGPVTVIVSGNRPFEMMRAQEVRYAAFDGRLSDLESDLPANFMPLISDNWTNHFTWVGKGSMPEEERRKLKDIVETAHSKGWKVRFWATPDEVGSEREAVWKELIAAGVDLLNTDQLEAAQRFLLENDPRHAELQ